MSYSAFRVEGYPTLYPDNKSPVYEDLLVYGIIFCFCILGFSFLVVIPGVRGIQRLYVTVRIFTSLFIGAFILVSNFGQEFEVARLKSTTTQYKAFTKHEINASITVKIGLRSVNITLLGRPLNQLNETINYNERFSWEWAQGRNGFGPQAGRIQREFRAAQVKGLPYPILWIAEYFTFDGEGMRYGRHYRTAGWYSHIMLWLAFSLWVLSNILFMMVVRYGAFYLFLTGCSLLIANILFASIRNFLPLKIPFEHGVLEFRYGWSFYLTLFTGLLCVFLGILLFILDHREPDFIATFFGLDVLQDYEEFYADPGDLHHNRDKAAPEISDTNRSQEIPQEHPDVYGLRKRTFSERLQRKPTRGPASSATSSGNPPVVPPRGKIFPNQNQDEGDPVYENIALQRFDPIGEEDESQDIRPPNEDYTTVLVEK